MDFESAGQLIIIPLMFFFGIVLLVIGWLLELLVGAIGRAVRPEQQYVGPAEAAAARRGGDDAPATA
jgi:hypothetical protein